MGSLVVTVRTDSPSRTRTKTYAIPDQDILKIYNCFKKMEVITPEGYKIIVERTLIESIDAWIKWMLDLTKSTVKAYDEQEVLKTISSLAIVDQTPPTSNIASVSAVSATASIIPP